MTAPYVTTVTKPAAAGTPADRRLRRWLLLLLTLLTLLLAAVLLTWLLMPTIHQQQQQQQQQQPAGGWVDRGIRHRAHKDDVCSLPMKIGPCRGAKTRFYFNVDTGDCTEFLYGGCEGNENNFDTMQECRTLCQPSRARKPSGQDGLRTIDKEPEICSLPATTGDCRAALPRYHFDPETSKCREFIYGGCGGNANNFKTIDECRAACASDARTAQGDDCSSSPEPGLCMAYMEKYAYDPDSGECQQFVYGGCGGNRNRYETKEECEARCKAPAAQQNAEVSAEDHDTRVCGVSECPADCGTVRRDGDCMLCQCEHEPFLHPGELAVANGQHCPHGYTEVRRDFSATVCSPDGPVPTRSP